MEVLFVLFIIIGLIAGFFPILNIGGLYFYLLYCYKASRDMVIVCRDDVDLFVKEVICLPYTLIDNLRECVQEQSMQCESRKPIYETSAQAVGQESAIHEEQGDISSLGRKLLVGQSNFYVICNFLMFFTSICSTSCSMFIDFGKAGNECGRYIMMACFVMLSFFLVLNTITIITIFVKRGKVCNLIKEAFLLYDSKNGMSSRIYCISCIALFALAIVQMWFFFTEYTTTAEIMDFFWKELVEQCA